MIETPKTTGTVFLIPLPLSPDALETIPTPAKEKAISIKHYFVENIRTARRFLKSIDQSISIDEIQFSEINQHKEANFTLLTTWLRQGYEIGIMSEAGCPGIADPGSEIVAKAHEQGAKVIPFTGPNSLLLALMASGFNGQSFRFLGYLPIKNPERRNAIREMELISSQRKETQIFIETPYRNMQLFEDLMKNCQAGSRLCIAKEITNPDLESIQSKTIKEWKNQIPDLHKHPVVFLLLGS